MHLFTTGQIGTHRSAIVGFRWDAGVVPKGKAARRTTGGGTAWAIPTQSRHTEEAWWLLQDLLSVDSQKALASIFYPSRKAVGDWYLLADPQLPPKNRKTILEAGNHLYPDPVHPKWDEIDTLIQKHIEPVLAGAVAAPEVATAIKRDVDALLAAQ